MSDIIQMQLKAEISSASIKHMQAQIKELESKPLKINIDTSSASKSVKGLSTTMEGMTKPANLTTLSFKELGLTVDKVTSEVTSLASGVQGVTKKITEATDVSGKMLKITESLNIETGKTQKTVESVTESYKGQRKAMEDIASFQRKMLGADGQLGQLDQFAKQKDGQFNPKFLEDITSRVKALNPEMANYGTNIKNINTDFGLLKGSTQELGSVWVEPQKTWANS